MHIEKQISEIFAEECRAKALNFKQFCVQNGSVNVQEMWKLKKKLWPKHSGLIPTGKINHQGQLVTSPQDFKNLLTEEFNERLRPRPNHPDFENIDVIKQESFKIKLEQATNNQSPPWNIKELEEVLQKLSENKSRDPHGLNRSIFHTNCIGNDLKESLLTMFNKLKINGDIPDFMKVATITTIPKKGSKFILKNERGIFILSAVRSILMRLLYNTKYETINSNMSDSNVGGRKHLSCINHIFVINGVIHEVLSSKKNTPVTIQIYEFKQMFDSMNLEEAMSDLFDSGMTDNTFKLLYSN